jgi:Co/Zn/Cd efflux system component
MTNFISLASFILAVFVFGISIGRLIEKIERFIHEKEDGTHRNAQKNDRR